MASFHNATRDLPELASFEVYTEWFWSDVRFHMHLVPPLVW